ncbi:MAG: hypothetical protein RBR12_12210 [Sulfurospirillum cavolei]|nr:hypothetical protein [Sulfurospirillum cavolei]
MKSSYLLKILLQAIIIYSNNGKIDSKFSISNFYKAVCKKIIEALLWSIFFSFLASKIFDVDCGKVNISSDALQVFSGILGFGIAAYTILISSFDKVTKFFQSRKTNENSITIDTINANMLYPLVMITMIIFCLFFISCLSDSFIKYFFSMFLSIYGILLTLELLFEVYLIANMIIVDVIKNDKTNLNIEQESQKEVRNDG